MTKEYKVTFEHVQDIIDKSKEAVLEPFEGCTIVAWQLPNGFVITEQSGCIDPKNYDVEIGTSICRKRLEDQVWMLEGYLVAQDRYIDLSVKDFCEKQGE